MRQFIRRKLIVLVTIAVMTTASVVPSQIVLAAGSAAAAAESAEVTALKTYKGNTAEFNAYVYYKNNVDLQTAIGANGDALLKHYNEYGKKEGRIAVDATVAAAATATTTTTATKSGSTGSGTSSAGFDTYNIPEQQNTEATYVLNKSTKKFHYPSCNDVKKIKPENYATSSSTRDELISQGYSSCGHCHP